MSDGTAVGEAAHRAAFRIMELFCSKLFTLVHSKDAVDVLLFYRIRLPHLRAHAAIQNIAYKPSPLTIVNLDIPGTAFRSIMARSCGTAVQVQVRSHSINHSARAH